VFVAKYSFGARPLRNESEARVSSGLEKCRAEGCNVLCSPVPDVEEIELYVGVEPGNPERRWQVMVIPQDDGVNEGNGGWPIARMLRVGDDLIDVASVDSDRTLGDFEL
jgi:hypothetical protein